MRAQLLALGLFAAVAVLAAACGDGDDAPPSTAGPRDVIAFGAREPNGGYGLYLVRPDGSSLRRLVEEAGEITFPVWSPAGDRIAYLIRPDLESPATLRVYDFPDGLATTVSQNALADLLGPTMSWSPDGRRLAFIDAAGGGRVHIYDIDRAGLIELPEVGARGVDWAPSGDNLAIVVGDPALDTDVDLMSEDGEDVRSLVTRSGLESGPRWSPNGDLLAFWSAPPDRPDQRELLVLQPGRDEPTELGPGFGAAWTADSGQLAYSRPASGAEADNLDIFIVPAGGGDLQPVSQSITRDRWPTWSPANDSVAYHAQADLETAFICVVQLDLESRDCPDLGGLLPGAPAWSPQ